MAGRSAGIRVLFACAASLVAAAACLTLFDRLRQVDQFLSLPALSNRLTPLNRLAFSHVHVERVRKPRSDVRRRRPEISAVVPNGEIPELAVRLIFCECDTGGGDPVR